MKSKMTPKFPQECCQITDDTARLGVRWIQHTGMRKNLGKLSNGSCHSLGVQVSHTGFAFDPLQHPGDCNPSFAVLISELLHIFELFQTSVERDKLISGSAELLLHPDSFKNGNLTLNPCIFISLLRTSQC